MKIPVSWNSQNKFCVARVHYEADPDKNEAWKVKAREGISERSWNREYEIAYDVFEGKPVYDQFNHADHVRDFEYAPGEAEYLYRGWDFGYHRPAAVMGWMGKDGVLYIRSEILGENEYIKEFGTKVRNFCWDRFPNARWLDACDPAGSAKKDVPDTTLEVLNGLGIYPIHRKSLINEGLEIIRQRLIRRNDGKFGLQIHPDCKILIDGMNGGYRYPDNYEGKANEETPLKDGYYDHVLDAFRYMCLNFLDLATTQSSPLESNTNSITSSPNDSLVGFSKDMGL